MRDRNYKSVPNNSACLIISPSGYDRRALDCSSTVVVNRSLHHLSHMLLTSPRTREVVCIDGAVETLVEMLARCKLDATDNSENARTVAWRWLLVLRCLRNIGTIGTESMREKLVQVGVIPYLVTILDNYQHIIRCDVETGLSSRNNAATSACYRAVLAHHVRPTMPRFNSFAQNVISDRESLRSLPSTALSLAPSASTDDSLLVSSAVASASSILPPLAPCPQSTRTAAPRQFTQSIVEPIEEDIIWVLEILSFVSKYVRFKDALSNSALVPSLSMRVSARNSYYSDCAVEDEESDCEYEAYDFEQMENDMDDDFRGEAANVFKLVEELTTYRHCEEIRYWAGVIMRNSCRRDDSRGKVRQCSNVDCGKWETRYREFAKCKRCRRTRYCSKECHVKASPIHRLWCMPPAKTSSTAGTATTESDARNEN